MAGVVSFLKHGSPAAFASVVLTQNSSHDTLTAGTMSVVEKRKEREGEKKKEERGERSKVKSTETP